jgi:predicted negative regulator of RcsB-dependent stress response
MARRRFRRKDLKRPDEFTTLGNQIIDWLQEHLRVVSYAGGAVVALGLVIGGSLSLHAARIRQANDDLAQALSAFQAGHYSQAATQLSDVASRWHATAAGRLARLYAANADLQADNLESARVLLEEVLRNHDWPPYLRQQALLDLGFALEAKGDHAAAAARYAEAAAVDGPYTSLALLGEARCREVAGEKAKARELYARYAREFPQGPDAALAEAKAAALKGPSDS